MLIDYNSLRENLNFNKKGRNQEKKRIWKKIAKAKLKVICTDSWPCATLTHLKLVLTTIVESSSSFRSLTTFYTQSHRRLLMSIGSKELVIVWHRFSSLSPLSVLFSVRAFLAIADCVRHRNLYNATWGMAATIKCKRRSSLMRFRFFEILIKLNVEFVGWSYAVCPAVAGS